MAGEPTQDELAGFTTFLEVAAWAGLDGISADANTAFGALCDTLGAVDSTPPRVIGMVKEGMMNIALGTWTIAGASPSIVQLGAADLLITACRLKCGTLETRAAMDARALALAVASAPSQSMLPPTPVPPPAPRARSIKLNLVCSQVDDTDVSILDEAGMLVAYARYQAVYGAGIKPPPDEDPAAEQLGALKYLVSTGQPPYVDFGIFGPHFNRTLRKLVLTGLVFSGDGSMQKIEIRGPPTFSHWSDSFAVFRNACLMLDIADLGVLMQYHDQIARYHSRYGPATWLLIYQSDVRTRLEHMPRTRRDLELAHSAAVSAGHTTFYDHKRPWNAVFREVLKDGVWWRAELEEPALFFNARCQALGNLVAGDAPVEAAHTSQPSAPQLAITDGPHYGGTHQKGGGGGGNKRNREGGPKPRVHEVENTAGGLRFSKNRAGNKLCDDFQTGACGEASRGNHCPNNRSLIHQCRKCLSPHHGADGPAGPCNGKGPSAQMYPNKGKGKGGGKGKKGKWGSKY